MPDFLAPLREAQRAREQAQRLAEQARERERAMREAQEHQQRAERERQFEEQRRFQEQMRQHLQQQQQRQRELQEQAHRQQVQTQLQSMRRRQDQISEQLPQLQNQRVGTSVQYLVDTIKQETDNDCLLAACRMLVRHKLSDPRISLFGRSLYADRKWLELEDNLEFRKAFIRFVNPTFDTGGLSYSLIPGLLNRFDLQSQYVAETPAGFADALINLGPFVYPAPQHALVITGIVEQGQQHFITYTDPSDGERHKLRFDKFLKDFPSSIETKVNNKRVTLAIYAK